MAFYSPRDLEMLGLAPDHNVKLLRLIRARMPSQSTEIKIRLSLIIQSLQKMAEKAYDMRQELLNPQAAPPPAK
jgi:hypothetical protein